MLLIFIFLNLLNFYCCRYLGCVSEHMNDLKPFGDVPQKLSLPLKRSFIAARTYAQSLNLAGDIVSNLIAVISFSLNILKIKTYFFNNCIKKKTKKTVFLLV